MKYVVMFMKGEEKTRKQEIQMKVPLIHSSCHNNNVLVTNSILAPRLLVRLGLPALSLDQNQCIGSSHRKQTEIKLEKNMILR